MILIIDNYDSFTYNIAQELGRLGMEVLVWRNDKFSLDDIRQADPAAIILSPGPGHPADAGLTCQVLRTYSGQIPILGVCLGHQAIGLVEGGNVIEANRQMHGKISRIKLCNDHLFAGLGPMMEVVRYHSLVIDRHACPESLKVIARDDAGEIMAVRHKTRPVYGVQFHPESYSTEGGTRILSNFVEIAQNFREDRHEKNTGEA